MVRVGLCISRTNRPTRPPIRNSTPSAKGTRSSEPLANDGLEWRGGDNDFWGQYLVCHPNDSHSKLRLFVDDGRLVIDMSTLPGEEGMLSYEVLEGIIEEKILRLLKARDIQPHSGWE